MSRTSLAVLAASLPLSLVAALACSEPLSPIDDGEGEGSIPIGGDEGEGGAAAEGEGGAAEGEGAGEGEGNAAGEGEGGGAGEGEGEGEGCALTTGLGDPEKPRVVLVGHTFTDDPNVDDTEIRSLTLTGETLVDDGMRLDVHTPPVRIAFAPSGAFALVIGDRGHVTSVRVDGAGALSIAAEIELGAAGFGDLHFGDEKRAYATNFDSTATAGVRAIDVGCDGALSEDTAAFLPMRLSNSLAMLPSNRAVLLGGQAVFAPIDDDDLRILSLGSSVTQVAPFDFWSDAVNDTRIGASPDGTRAAVPNASPFSSQGGDIVLLAINGDVLSEIDRVHAFSDCAEAVFAPDGQTLLVSQAEPNRVAVFNVSGGTLVEGTSIENVGLAEQMDMVSRGSEAGLVLVAATNAVGNIHMLRVTGPGAAIDLGKLDLGAASEDIPVAIALQP